MEVKPYIVKLFILKEVNKTETLESYIKFFDKFFKFHAQAFLLLLLINKVYNNIITIGLDLLSEMIITYLKILFAILIYMNGWSPF